MSAAAIKSRHRQISSFIENMDKLSNTSDVVLSLRGTLAEFGFEYFCLCGLPKPQQNLEEVTLTIRVPDEWLQLYLREQYADIDPFLRQCRQTANPFHRKDVQYDPVREPRAAEMIERAADFGLLNGLFVPIPSAGGCIGLTWMGGRSPDFSAHTRPMLHLIGLYSFARIYRDRASKLNPPHAITSREREALAWSAEGKSAWEIGEILAISERTVNEHLQTAFQKLGAVNKTHAVVIAIRERIINF